MACQIKRNSNGIITQVLAPNGKNSILYRDIVNNLSNPQTLAQVKQDPYVSMVLGTEYIKGTDVSEVGLAAWSKAYSAGFINQFGDWKTQTIANTDVNGEPNVDVLFPDLKVSNVKEGVDFVFEQNPELASIGTQEQYSEYIDTVFPDSKVKDIVYHGSNQKIEQFEVRKEPLIHFGSKNAALQRGGILNQVLLNIKDLQTIKDGMWFLGTDEGGLLKELLDRNILTIEQVKSINEAKNKAIQQSPYFNENYRMALPEGEKAGNKKLQEILKDKNIGFKYVNFSEDKGSTSYAVPSQEQIHILGSKQDIEGFKKFVSGEQLPSTVDNIINMKRWTQTKNNCPKL